MRPAARLCVYCGSKTGNDPIYGQTATALGRALARRGLGLVYGGGSIGLMGLLADAALSGGAEVIGVIPHRLNQLEFGHQGLNELIVVQNMHERKARMAQHAQAFLALPGGYGTLEELFEALAWSQLGLHRKPVGLLNLRGYFDQLVAFLDRAVGQGFLSPRHRELVRVDQDLESLLDELAKRAPAPD